ncbi:MAG: NAD(P)-dependent alcohol dehydrogenase [Kiritimatiellaeota bacterium]|nr:NAD(P)-dependent alcohol dehydrogenase [Kiritimatiellota bacterium]
MADTMKCAVLHGVGDVRIEERPVPVPGSGEVLIKIMRVGVCGSDVHYFTHGRIGDFVITDPLVLGHECAGMIQATGPDTGRFQPGDRVAVEPGSTCRTCFYCKSGSYNLCGDVAFMGTPPVDGAFCEYVVWPEDFVFALPDAMTFEDGAMMEPLVCGLWAVHRGGVKTGDCVAVFGSGPIGLLALQAAKVAGAATLIAVDIDEFRLDFARKIGATHTVNDRDGNALEQVLEISRQVRPDFPECVGVDVAFETAGAIPTTRNTLAATRRGGVAVLVGLPPEPMVELDIVEAASKEIDIRGMFRYANRYPTGIALTLEGRVDVRSLVTHRFPLDAVRDALEFADTNKASSMKVMVEVG